MLNQEDQNLIGKAKSNSPISLQKGINKVKTKYKRT